MNSERKIVKVLSSIGTWLLLGVLLIMGNNMACVRSAPQLGEAPVEDVIGAMTLREKAQLVVGMGFQLPPNFNIPDSVRARMGVSDAALYPQRVPGAAGWTHPFPRLGIPSLTLSDGPAGVRIQPIRNQDSSQTYYATAFPISSLLASSWDTALVKTVGEAFGNEVLEYGIDVLLAPALNIHRNPLAGRNFEYYSEDPLISGSIAAAMVEGVQSNGVGTSIKHFVANNSETNRRSINTVASERALREIYLRGFEIAVKRAQPWTVMSSYNLVNGTYTAQRHDLLTDVLRDEWGFRGFVMTDWGGGDDPVEQMKAGNNLVMPGNDGQIDAIVGAVESGNLEMETLDRNVEGMLNIILKSPAFNGYEYSDAPDLAAHAQVARQAATRSMVLLKNRDGALPLSPSENIATFGNATYDIIIGGTGSGSVNEAYTVQLEQGLSDAGFTLDGDLAGDYRQYIDEARANRTQPQNFMTQFEPIPEMSITTDRARQEAENNDVALITIGRNAGEGADRDQADFYLNDREKALIASVSDAFHARGKKVVAVLNIDGVIDVASWENQVDGILLAWQPGQEAGHAITDVLGGSVNPSGRLASTFPVDYSDVPSAGNFPGTPEDDPQEIVYREGIFNGYRYYDTFNVTPAYEFGYGLSYTTFSYDEVNLNSSMFDEEIMATTRVTNTGSVAGREVVQLYLSAPAGMLDKPAQELKGFAVTGLLEPGESQSVSFRIRPMDLASFNPGTSGWEADAGTYRVRIGASSRDIRQTASFEVGQKMTVENVHDVLHPGNPVDEMKP